MATTPYPGRSVRLGDTLDAHDIDVSGFVALTPQVSDPVSTGGAVMYTKENDEGLWFSGSSEYPTAVRHGQSATYSGLHICFGSSNLPQYVFMDANGITNFVTVAYIMWPGTTNLGTVTKIVANAYHTNIDRNIRVRLVDSSGNNVADTGIFQTNDPLKVQELIETLTTPLPATPDLLSLEISARKQGNTGEGRCASISFIT